MECRMIRKTINGSAVLNTAQAAKYLGLAPSTLEKMRVYGGGPIFVNRGRSVGYLVEDLDEYLDRGRGSSTSERDG
jgi:hypothetical protein